MQTPVTTTTPPYYAVIFTSIRTETDNGYGEIAHKVLEEATKQAGFLGFESARNEIGISISYWESLEAIETWKANTLHKSAMGKAKEFYKFFRVRVCKVEREYGF